MQPSEKPVTKHDGATDLESIKAVVVGPQGAGKSSLIRALAKDSISVERFGSSVSLDFGCVVFGRHEVNIFGTPGKTEFRFMQRILGHGADVCILVVDAHDTDGIERAKEVYDGLREGSVPIVVVANKQDLEGTIEPAQLRRLLELGEEPVVGTSALEGQGMEELVVTIIDALKEREEA